VSAETAAEGFWDFSVRTYRTPGVPDSCLSLQNDSGADVNMLLYCCWIGAYLGRFADELFAQASEFSTNWAASVVVPLRSARTWMKHTGCSADSVPAEACMQLREEIKAVEFASEKMQQEVLGSLVSVEALRRDAPDRILADVAGNLLQYAEYTDIDVCDDVRRKFAVIISAAFPAWDEQKIERALEL
jgi:uncharacterized protein (TIGR02444 family)